MAVTLRLPDDLDVHRRARREGCSKQELAIEAIRDVHLAELKVEDVLAELVVGDAEILDYLK